MKRRRQVLFMRHTIHDFDSTTKLMELEALYLQSKSFFDSFMWYAFKVRETHYYFRWYYYQFYEFFLISHKSSLKYWELGADLESTEHHEIFKKENPLYMQTGNINFINWTFNFSVTLDGIYDIISSEQQWQFRTRAEKQMITSKLFIVDANIQLINSLV